MDSSTHTGTPAATPPAAPRPDYILQHIVLRQDLLGTANWTAGAVVAQACHASVAAIAKHMSDPLVVAYLADLPNMAKAVVEV
jgi:hypothetical protein